MVYDLMRVALLATLFFIPDLGWSKKNSENLETYKDQISKAQVLLLQHDRYQAAQILAAAILREGPKSPGHSELIKSLRRTVEIFFSENAQQSFEMALSSYPINKQQTIDKLNATSSLEPNNGLVAKALMFTLLGQRECASAIRHRNEYAKLNPFDPELEKFRFLEFVCQKNKSEVQGLLAKVESANLSQAFWVLNKQRLGVDEAIAMPQGQFDLQKESPELSYYAWLSEKDQKKRMALAERYKNLCHTSIPFDMAYAWMDPWACEHLKEIDDYQVKGERGN